MGAVAAAIKEREDKHDRGERGSGEAGKGLSTPPCFASPLHRFPSLLNLYLLPGGIRCLGGSNPGARSTAVALF
jgi:hypothetical protein